MNVQKLCGWRGPEEARRAWEQERIRSAFTLYPRGCRPHGAYQRYAPWDHATTIAIGQKFPNAYAQETGDCVSFGCANALQWLTCTAIAAGAMQRFAYIYPPYLYAIGRNSDAGGNGQLGDRSQGSLGSWMISSVKKYGVLFYADDSGLQYSGKIAEEWGAKSRTPWKKWAPTAVDNLVKAASRLTTGNEVRDIVCSGGACTIASNYGYKMQLVKRHGKHWFTGKDTWPHQTCIVAYAPAGDTGPHPDSLYQDNSWGTEAHGGEQADGPTTGGWVELERIHEIVSDPDTECYGISAWEGFPARELDLHTF